MLGYVKYIIYEQEESLRLWLTCRSIDLFTVKILCSHSWYLGKKTLNDQKNCEVNYYYNKTGCQLLLNENEINVMYSGWVLKTGTRDASGTLTWPYKNQKNGTQDPSGTLAGSYKSRKTRTRDPSETFRKFEKRELEH